MSNVIGNPVGNMIRMIKYSVILGLVPEFPRTQTSPFYTVVTDIDNDIVLVRASSYSVVQSLQETSHSYY